VRNNTVDDKVILITGTSRGLGRYLAEYYCKKGFKVIGCSRSPSQYSDSNYKHFEGDISEMGFIREIFKFIKSEFGRLDVLVNNAVANPPFVNSVLLAADSVEKALKINVIAPMMFCQEAIKLMKKQVAGRIINIGSMVSKHEELGGAIYSTCKSAINTYSRVIAKEVSKTGITVNVVAVSALETELSEKLDHDFLMNVLKRNAIDKMGEMKDVSNLIDFLIRKESSAITSQILFLGGV